MHGVEFLDHLDAGAAVFGDLVDIGALHQAQADVGVPKAVGRARQAFAILLETLFDKSVASTVSPRPRARREQSIR